MGYYIDEDYTGTDSERPDFKRLLKDLGSRRVNMLLVTDLSRLSRNISESIHYVQGLFVALDVRFISTQLPMLDSYLEPQRIYSLEVPIQSMMNEQHCADTSFKVRRTFDMLRKEGKFIGAFAPYGFQKDPGDKHKLIQDKEAVQVIRMMFEWLQEGHGVGSIAKMLNDRGIPNPTAYKTLKGINYCPANKNPSPFWSTKTVKSILTQPINGGTLVQGRNRVVSYKIHKQIRPPEEEWFVKENMVEPIFSPEERKAIQGILQRRTRVSKKGKEEHLFTGFLKCADCGKSISRTVAKNRVYYVCRTYRNYTKACTSHCMAEYKLEKAVFMAIQQQISVAVSLKDVVKELDQTPIVTRKINNFGSAIQARKKELEKITAYKRSLYKDWKDGEITQEEYREMKSEFTDQEERLHHIIETLSKELEQVSQVTDEENPVITHFLKYQNMDSLTRELLLELVEHIIIHEGGNITIQFKFMDEYQNM